MPASKIVYSDSLVAGWVDYSWTSGIPNFAATSPVRSGTKAIAVNAAQWQALSLHSSVALAAYDYASLR